MTTDILTVKNIEKKENYFTTLIKIAVPLIITTSSQSIMTFVDRIMLSWHSPDALAACIPAGMISFTMIVFFMGTCGYTNVFVANYYGKKRYANLSVSLWQGVLLSFISWLFVICLIPLGTFIIASSGHAPEVKILENQYFVILTLFGGVFILNNALAGFFTGQGRAAITMAVNVAGNVLNVFLSYSMIFGKFGFPHMGMRGAAWSTVIGGLFISLVFFYLILFDKSNKKFRVGKLFGFHKKAFFRLVKYGIPNGFGFFMDVVSFSVFVFITGNIDKFSLAASNIVLSLEQIVFMPMLGLAIATQVLMGQSVGKKRPDIGIKYTWQAIKLGAVYAAVLVVLFLSIPTFFTGLFAAGHRTAEMEIILSKTVPLMYLLCLFTVGDLFFLVFGDAIRGAGDTRFHMKAMVSCSVLLLTPGTYIIASVLNLGIVAAWGWIVFYAWLTGGIMCWRFLSKRWQNIDITK